MYVYVCFVFALVRKNGIVRAPEVKPLINQSINHKCKSVDTLPNSKLYQLHYIIIYKHIAMQ